MLGIKIRKIKRCEFSHTGEHTAHIGDTGRIKVCKIQALDFFGAIKHTCHIYNITGIKFCQIKVLNVSKILEHARRIWGEEDFFSFGIIINSFIGFLIPSLDSIIGVYIILDFDSLIASSWCGGAAAEVFNHFLAVTKEV